MRKLLKKAFVTHPGFLFVFALILGMVLMYLAFYMKYIPCPAGKP